MKLEKVLQIGIQLVDIVERLHGSGFVHSDIKPDNVLFGIGREKDLVHLIDYGNTISYNEK